MDFSVKGKYIEGSEIIVPNESLQFDIDVRRSKEVVFYIDNVKGTEADKVMMSSVAPTGIDADNAGFYFLAVGSGNPMVVQPFLYKFVETQASRIALPVGFNERTLRIKIQIETPGATPGNFAIGVALNKLR